MSKKQIMAQSKIIFYPPSTHVIDKFAKDVCERLGEKDPTYTSPEIIRDFSRFIQLAASIYAKYLSTHPEAIPQLDNKSR